ncbi:hypothetical protein [Natronorubrum halophilum]|uniref:hypothetical protein n=1 Tax=Natronorubrum halophilum TaxID=1702106 RepID=UPI000EF689C4|nr:hypothetical protein [Natronorubrum halophilum]
MNNRELFAAAVAAAVLLSLFALPGAVAATVDASIADDEDIEGPDDNEATDGNETDDENETDDGDDVDDPSISVTQDGNTVTVSLTAGGEAVTNTTVTAEAVDGNVSYSAGETTDANGTATFDAPTTDESVDVVFEATVDDEPVETTATLERVEDADPKSFGQLLDEFKTNDVTDDEPLGLQIASFVVETNPGNAPDHAGPPSHAGPPDEDTDEKDDQDPSDEKGNGGGPPSHAGSSP